jgi:hypothetical protein
MYFLKNIQIYQVGVLVLSAVMLFFSIRGFVIREPGQTVFKFLVRLTVWGGLGVISIYPNLTRVIARILGIEDNINAVILIGFIFTFLVIFKLLSAIDKIEQNVSELTRKIALKDLDDQVANTPGKHDL